MSAEHRAMMRTGVAIGVAVGVIGASFGVLARADGVSPVMACAMSVLIFAGGSQFLAIGVIASGGGPGAAVLGGLLLNARHIPYGLALVPMLRGSGLGRRLLASVIVIDESTAFALGQPTVELGRRAFYTVGITLFVCWQLGTAIGAIVGGAVGDPAAIGLDAAFPAGILAFLVPQLRSRGPLAAAAAGAAIALLATPFAPAGAPILLAGLGVAAGLAAERRR